MEVVINLRMSGVTVRYVDRKICRRTELAYAAMAFLAALLGLSIVVLF